MTQTKTEPLPFDFNHPGYLGVGRELPPEDKRLSSYQEQLNTLGYDSTYVWNLDTTLATFLGKMLEQLALDAIGYPCDLNSLEEWQGLLKTNAQAFQTYLEVKDEAGLTIQDIDKVKEACYFIGDRFRDLWD